MTLRLLIDGVIYDSTKVAVLIQFDENEQRLFDMKRFVSAPPKTTEKERWELLNYHFEDDVPLVSIGDKKCKHTFITTWNHGYHNWCHTCGELNVEPVRD